MSVCAVMVEYGASQVVVPGVAGAKLTMPNRKPAVVDFYTAAVVIAADPEPTMTNSTYAVVV